MGAVAAVSECCIKSVLSRLDLEKIEDFRDKRYYRICLSFIRLSVLFDLLNELFDLPDLPCGLRHRRAAVAAPQGHTVLQVQRVIHVRLEELGDSLQLLQRQLLQCLAPGRALGHQMAGDGVGVPEGHAPFFVR